MYILFENKIRIKFFLLIVFLVFSFFSFNSVEADTVYCQSQEYCDETIIPNACQSLGFFACDCGSQKASCTLSSNPGDVCGTGSCFAGEICECSPPPAPCSITFTADDTTPDYNTSTNLRFSLSGNFPWSISLLAGSVWPSPSSGESSSGVLSTNNLTSPHVYRLTCGSNSSDVTVTPGSAGTAPSSFSIWGGCSGWSSSVVEINAYETSGDTYTLQRREGSGSWINLLTNANYSTFNNYVDSSVYAGGAFDYRVLKTNAYGSTYSDNILYYPIDSATCGGASCPASGTLLSTYCSGTSLYGVYANGSCGTYNQLIQSNSPSCGGSTGTPYISNISKPVCSNVNYTVDIAYNANGGGTVNWLNIANNSSFSGYYSGQVPVQQIPPPLLTNPVRFPNGIVWPSDGGFMFYGGAAFNLAPNTNYWTKVANASVDSAAVSWSVPSCSVPTVTTPTVSSITTTGATLGANVTSLGVPASISARGTCWGTTPAPTTNCTPASGITTGVFTHARTGLSPNTTYYFRGYATNTTGTGYSADGTFTTLAVVTSSLTVNTAFGSLTNSGSIMTRYNDTPTVSWSSTNASSCSLTSTKGDSRTGTSGSFTALNLNAPAQGILVTYTLSCTGASGTVTKSIDVSVPPTITPVSGICSADGTSGTFSWTPPSGYNTFYTRVSVDGSTIFTMPTYDDNFVGTSKTFTTTPGKTYWWWVHTKAPNWAYSIAMGGSFTCSIFPDLTVTTAPTPIVATVNIPLTFTATTTNGGGNPTGSAFNNLFQVATGAGGTGTISVISVNARAALDSGASGPVTSSSYTFPSVGTYSVRVCADNNASFVGTITESNESNNCGAWTNITVSPMPTTNVTISSPTVIANGTTQYTISVTGSNSTGAQYISNNYALINLQGDYAGTYRGYLTWRWSDIWPTAKDRRACTGSGGVNDYAVIQGNYGPQYLNLDSCNVSDVGNNRTTTFVVRFDPVFTTPVTNNDISGLSCTIIDIQRCTSWMNFPDLFSLGAVPVVPTVGSPTVSNITTTGATLGANVTSLGVPASISARGTCWGTTPAPTTNCTPASGTTTGVFTHTRTGLSPNTTYYYRGYATNSTGTGYSADGTFITSQIPIAGTCGTANKTYPVGSNPYGSDTFCSAGTPSPASPAVPNPGQTVTWICLGLNGGASSPTCSATLVQATHTLNIPTRPTGGTVIDQDSTSYINCGTNGTLCAHTYNEGSTVTLIATPSSSYWEFLGWGGDCSGTASTCNIGINSAKNVTATFGLRQFNYKEF